MGWISDILKEAPLSAVLREKVMMADAENERLKAENASLRQENDSLHIRVQQAEQKIHDLEERLHPTHLKSLTSDQEKMLSFVASRDGTETAVIAQQFGMAFEACKFHLWEFEKCGAVSAKLGINGSVWRIAQEGRRYLVSKNLLR